MIAFVRALHATLFVTALGLANAASAQTGGTDYSSDDTLIDVRTAEQLNAIRWDLDGDGVPAASTASYFAAFPDAAPGMGCDSTCTGYVLRDDIDLGLSRWGRSSGTAGWAPIGGSDAPYVGRFDGAGHVVKNLFVSHNRERGLNHLGLFGQIGESGVIERLGIVDAVVVGSSTQSSNVGALAGTNKGEIRASYATGIVNGFSAVGGLVGANEGGGDIAASYAVAVVSGGRDGVGGLAGNNFGRIIAGYAVGTVSAGGDSAGGLVGINNGPITASYVVARVDAPRLVGGLVGLNLGSGSAAHSYWDTDVSGLFEGVGAVGVSKTTSELQTPTTAAGIYSGWNVDVDGDSEADAPWDFGTDSQYPVLRGLGTAAQHAALSGNDARLQSIAISPGELRPVFDSEATSYTAILNRAVAAFTVTATAADGSATIAYSAADADETADGHQSGTTATVVITVTSPNGVFRDTYTLRVTKEIDYSENDRLIDVRNAEQLNAMRWDLDGNGKPVAASTASYFAAFPDAAPGMGCDSTCTGYVLRNDIDLGLSRWSSSSTNGWVPIGGSFNSYRSQFDGAGHVVRNLFINRANLRNTGLFSQIGATGEIERLGVVDANVTGKDYVGALAGRNAGEIRASYATGSIKGDDTFDGSGTTIGGLVGFNIDRGIIAASYAVATVSGGARVGGLVGQNQENSEIRASYAIAAAGGTGARPGVNGFGGLVGINVGRIRASYAVGVINRVASDFGGLVGRSFTGANVADSYWDTDASGLFISAGGTSQTSSELRVPTAATGIYSNWNVDVDGDDEADDPWDFGTDRQYPVLRYGGLSTATQFAAQPVDYTSDGRRIDVRTAEQLNAIRWDLDGDGAPAAAGRTLYSAAFPGALPGMGCISTCEGYVLRNDIDLGASRWGRGNNIAGWRPIGTSGAPYTGRFDGDGHVVRNLFIDRGGQSNVGLFGRIGQDGKIEGLGVVDANVTGRSSVGALAGENAGDIRASYAVATATGVGANNFQIGGLVGLNDSGGKIIAGYAVAAVSGAFRVGGLVGKNDRGVVMASYAVATVNGTDLQIGGLVGANNGSIDSSYAVATVGGSNRVGGLVGTEFSGASTATHSYWDTDVSSLSVSAGGVGKTTSELRTPTTATGIYSTWAGVDIDGKTEAPWDFGTDSQYPVLRYGVLSTATQFAAQPAFDTVLQSLTLSQGYLQPAFDSGVADYTAFAGRGASMLTIMATAAQPSASVVYSPADEDMTTDGHQIKSTATVTITVTSPNGRFQRIYTLRATTDVDYSNDDERIDVRNAEQLNAIRWDLDGDGVPAEASSASYFAAFPDPPAAHGLRLHLHRLRTAQRH